ncbi:DNA-binding MarR family transcriptional regulator [Tamaricihabitans halophyticus]|uniref:DNA-binding MarR family transcriptional regulator n=1 Tax=Tamaricihabitans halophyticus TaxID=1262583 RepID=A0A4R2R0J4_9PSEU|nr:MarR family transcriptional regulator [Tamaricihabitans halophyticus]TCP56152.1 DNA-binding MarR family transcriptional regulator [Tamaricihabitans halophyticus]
MSSEPVDVNRWQLSTAEHHTFREFFTAVTLNAQVTADTAGLRPTDLYVLNVLELSGQVTAGEIATRTGLTTGAVTKLVDRLVRAGLVERIPDSTDRRKVLLHIVDQAAEDTLGGASASLFTPVGKRMDDLLSSLPTEHRAAVFDFFRQATGALQAATRELQQQQES